MYYGVEYIAFKIKTAISALSRSYFRSYRNRFTNSV